MKDYLIGIPTSLVLGLILTLGFAGFEFVSWGEFFALYALFSFGLWFLFVREKIW
jgi:hypothetical protein